MTSQATKVSAIALPHRKRPAENAVTTIHPLEDSVLVTVNPPLQPLDAATEHVPCDIVLVIDTSGSMKTRAPFQMQRNARKAQLDPGFSIMDLVKHAARITTSLLSEGDQIGIVTFDAEAKVVQELAPVTRTLKKKLDDKIAQIKLYHHTNLWRGILMGHELLRNSKRANSVRALMVLTDGMPNRECPDEGFVSRLEILLKYEKNVIINTFGFGIDINSGMLTAIAEITKGNFSHIVDPRMLGTVFVHAIAHLQSTFATECTLELSAPQGALLRTTTGKHHKQTEDEGPGSRTVKLTLGNLQYGQSRDIYLENVNISLEQTNFALGPNKLLRATLKYTRTDCSRNVTTTTVQDLSETSDLPPPIIAYHKSRSMICKWLSSFSVLYYDLHYRRVNLKPQVFSWGSSLPLPLDEVIASIPARNYDDELNKSLMHELEAEITGASCRPSSFRRWGYHYFLGLRNAHTKQLCSSSRDVGPLMYNKDSPLFKRCRDRLNDAFNGIARPTPSLNPRKYLTTKTGDSYPYSDTICITAQSPVLLATGYEIPVCDLRVGMEVCTPVGDRRVKAVLQTFVHQTLLCRVGEILVAPWHPIQYEDEYGYLSEWTFPADVASEQIDYSGTVYSVLLERHEDADAHALQIGCFWGVTLGHGILQGDDIRAHPFLGDYDAVLRELELLKLPDAPEPDVYDSAGVKRDPITDIVYGFESVPEC